MLGEVVDHCWVLSVFLCAASEAAMFSRLPLLGSVSTHEVDLAHGSCYPRKAFVTAGRTGGREGREGESKSARANCIHFRRTCPWQANRKKERQTNKKATKKRKERKKMTEGTEETNIDAKKGRIEDIKTAKKERQKARTTSFCVKSEPTTGC